MRKNRRIQLFAAACGMAAVFVGAAYAQHATLSPAPQAAASPARTVRSTPAHSTKGKAGATRPHASANALLIGDNFDAFNPLGTAGLGFGNFGFAGFPSQNLAIEAAIDPATQWRLFEARKILHNTGFSGPGFYLLDGGAYYQVPGDSGDAGDSSQQQDQQPQQQQQPIVIVQAPQNGQAGEPSAQSEQQESAEQSPEEVGQFVLVLRSGKQIQAVAFSRSGERIVYITADGLRHSLALADVDAQSTIRINDERGTPVQLPL